jgi:hypothetical protein
MKAVQGLQKKNTWPFFLKQAKLQFDLVSQARGKGIVLLKTYTGILLPVLCVYLQTVFLMVLIVPISCLISHFCILVSGSSVLGECFMSNEWLDTCETTTES